MHDREQNVVLEGLFSLPKTNSFLSTSRSTRLGIGCHESLPCPSIEIPLLWLLGTTIVSAGLGRVFAAADDIAIAVDRLASVSKFSSVLNIFSSVSGTSLQPVKCEYVLCSIAVSGVVREQVKAWLRLHIPACAHFRVVSHGQYLGL